MKLSKTYKPELLFPTRRNKFSKTQSKYGIYTRSNQQLEFCTQLQLKGLATFTNASHLLPSPLIHLGPSDEKRIRKACGRAREVFIYTYAQRSAEVWWQQMSSKLERFDNLHVIALPEKTGADLTQLA